MLNKLIRWARITKAGTDTEEFAVQQLEYLGKLANGFVVFPYGIHGNLPPDSLALMMSVQGSAANRAVIGWTPKVRPTLEEGEVAFYHPPTGSTMVWRQNGDLDINTAGNINVDCSTANVNASSSVTIDTPSTTVTGDLNVGGNTTITGNAVAANVTAGGAVAGASIAIAGVDIGPGHTHPAGNPPGNTGGVN